MIVQRLRYDVMILIPYGHSIPAALLGLRVALPSFLAAAGKAIFDLGFHTVMHWGRDPPWKALRACRLPAGPVSADVLRPRHRHPAVSRHMLIQVAVLRSSTTQTS